MVGGGNGTYGRLNSGDDREAADEADRLQDRVSAGFIPDNVLGALVEEIEQVCENDGWDMPPRLFALVSPTSLAELSDGGLPDIEGVPFGASAIVAATVMEMDGHPREALLGMVAPPLTLGLVLSTETWSFPQNATQEECETLRPSEHPRRVEARDVLLVAADGRQRWCRRVRGSDTTEGDADKLTGALVDLVRASLRLPPNEPAVDALTLLCTAIALIGNGTGGTNLPLSDPAVLVALLVTATNNADASTALGGRSVENVFAEHGTVVADFVESAVDRWFVGDDWMSDEILEMLHAAPDTTILPALARVVLRMSVDDSVWWPSSHLAQQIVEAGATIENLRSSSQIGDELKSRVEQTITERLQRVERLRARIKMEGL